MIEIAILYILFFITFIFVSSTYLMTQKKIIEAVKRIECLEYENSKIKSVSNEMKLKIAHDTLKEITKYSHDTLVYVKAKNALEKIEGRNEI